jgi:hypothetical protein
MSSRRKFLEQITAAGIAAAASGQLAHAADSWPPMMLHGAGSAESEASDILTYKQYLEKSFVPREVIDHFIQEPGWAKFDPELGYLLNSSLQADGIDHSSTFSTVQANGARTSYMYAGRKPRINTYGDSFTECHQVSDGETWQEVLAAHLGEPIGNFGMGGFGVYQAYLRMLREERTDHGAEYLIFYIWGDDPIRSLYRSRWAAIYRGFKASPKTLPAFFHANFWSNVEMDLDSGRMVEKEQLLTTKESLYNMTDPQWMVDHLLDDLAVQLWAYKAGSSRDLDRDKITKLAARLNFPFDWSLPDQHAADRKPWPAQNPMTPMQFQTEALLDLYSMRATQFILDKVRAFAAQNNKKLMVVLFDPYRGMVQMKNSGTRYDQEIVDYLVKEGVNYFDMNEVHLRDFKKFNLSWEEYMYRYFNGHYNPAGNLFFAFSIKDKIVEWLDPKPIPYQKPDQQQISFKGYLDGYR